MVKEVHYEFGGPIGALGVIVGLPVVIYGLYFLCNDQQCLSTGNPFDSDYWTQVASSLPSSLSGLVTGEAVAMYLGWMLFHVALERVLPGESVEGVALPPSQSTKTGGRLVYTMSGHLQFWLTFLAIAFSWPLLSSNDGNGDWWSAVYAVQGFARLPISLIYDHYLGLITVSIIFTTAFSLYLYISSFLPRGKLLAKGGNTGNALYDFFIGRELNPRLGSLDLKEFCELRPGLIGWAVINLGER
jgi:Delta14-sterol reductase